MWSARSGILRPRRGIPRGRTTLTSTSWRKTITGHGLRGKRLPLGLTNTEAPKSLTVHSAAELIAVAAELNARPRKTLDWKTPAEVLDQLLLSANKDAVATTA